MLIWIVLTQMFQLKTIQHWILQERLTTAPDVLEFDPFALSPPNQVHEEESTVGTALPSLELQSMILALLQDINRRMQQSLTVL